VARQPESGTRENIRKMVAIPHFTTWELLGVVSEHPLYAELADELDVPLLKGVWAKILGDKDLKSDAVHANAAGYRLFAEKLAGFLKKLPALPSTTGSGSLARRMATTQSRIWLAVGAAAPICCMASTKDPSSH